MVQIVAGHNLILYAFVVHLHGVVRIVAPEHKKVLDLELVLFGPSHFEPCLLGLWFVGFV